jgi:M6 family metalloprotease-like protein
VVKRASNELINPVDAGAVVFLRGRKSQAAWLVGMLLLLTSCVTTTPSEITDSSNSADQGLVIPSPSENSDHGYSIADNRIPKLETCAEWRAFFVYPGPAVSFAVASLFPEEKFEVSTEIYLKNRDLDQNGDGVICHFEAGVSSADPETEISPVSELAPVEECRIQQGGASMSYVTRSGFPQHPDYVIPQDNKIVIQLIYVDGDDLQGTDKPESDASFWIEGAGSFLDDVTDGKIELEWRYENEYFTLPKPLGSYNVTREKRGDPQAFVQAAITAADREVDFSEVDIVVAVPPPNINNRLIDFSPAIPLEARSPFTTAEGLVYRGTLAGADTRWEEGYLLIAHEIGHLMGLQDYYSHTSGDEYEDQFKYMGEFDNMNNAGGRAREWTAWSRWLLGTLEDDQIRCVTSAQDTTHQITTVSSESKNPKAVIVPTGTNTAIVVESRKSIRNDKGIPEQLQGLLVYKVDTRRASGFGPLEIVRKVGLSDPFLIDASLTVGESVTVDDIRIENVESGELWDVARITSEG